ncbi:MAG: VWA domain-containing protein [Eubacteriaceae bacterium]
MTKNVKVFLMIFGIAIVIFGVVYSGINLTKNFGKSSGEVSAEKAEKQLDKIVKDISIHTVEPIKGQIADLSSNVKDSLPEISKYETQVDPDSKNYIEIFSSTEKAGSGTDGWLVDMAKAFNDASITIDGKDVSVQIRGIASGTATDYILSEKYLPDAFSPSNELWGEMIKSAGVNISLIDKKLAGNVAGILLSQNKYDELIEKYGAVNTKTITEAVSNNEIAMGYTNPFASSTGLNFLLTTLNTFDSKDLLSEKAVEGFEKFQNNIPFVSFTTLQMRESAESGVLDGFVMEYQTYANSPEINTNYVFTPFGVRHDSPIYAIGNLSSEKTQILNAFIDFCKQESNQNLATQYGFNGMDEYKSEFEPIDGEIITRAQKLWKEKKNGTKSICAVFVADISGSMHGEPLNKLKESLLSGQKYIGNENRVGLITYSNDVIMDLPIGEFDINQRSYFTGAVNRLTASGGTATFDGIAVAIQMIQEEMAKTPDLKPMIFVLSDGETTVGHSLNEIEDIIRAYKIPIYTIGYNANIDALQSISSINEATSINADTDDVIYKLGNLFNAQM